MTYGRNPRARMARVQAKWRASAPAVVWADLDEEARIDYLCSAWTAGASASTMAAHAGTTKGAVLGWAWKRGLSVRNAARWTPEYGRRVVAHREPVEPKYARIARHRMADKIKRRVNLATDPATRAAVDRLNAIPLHDTIILAMMGAERASLTRWRYGRGAMSAEYLACIDETVRRLSE